MKYAILLLLAGCSTSCEIPDPVVKAHSDLIRLESECEAKGGLVWVAPGTSEARLELVGLYRQARCF